tara:strand:+ start:178 stop:558 length:381 start_codon:yes stop_codon:yes gene_type:complete
MLPIIEIALFVEVGSVIGSFNTISIIILSAFFGLYLIKMQTSSYIAEIRSKVMQGIRPDREIMSGIITLISGILFLIPGFLTDSVAILLLIPAFKYLLIKKYSFPSPQGGKNSRNSAIDGEYKEDD